MQQRAAAASNPLSRMAVEAPAMLGPALSIAARVAGAALAAYIASDQSYDRTRIFAIGVAALALISIIQTPPAARVTLSALASGLLFFAGALLLDQAAGIGMLAAGAAAICGVLIGHHRGGGMPGEPIGGFFFGLGLTVLWVAVIIFTVEG
jgi:hypothetical protein